MKDRKVRPPDPRPELAPEPETAEELARSAWLAGDMDAASRALAVTRTTTDPRQLLALALVRMRSAALEPARSLIARARAALAEGDALESAAQLVDLVVAAAAPDFGEIAQRGARDALLARSRALAASVTRSHERLARDFAHDAGPAVERVLFAARKSLAEELAQVPPPTTADRPARLAAALTSGLTPLIEQLASLAADALSEARVALTEHWTGPAARVLQALVHDHQGPTAPSPRPFPRCRGVVGSCDWCRANASASSVPMCRSPRSLPCRPPPCPPRPCPSDPSGPARSERRRPVTGRGAFSTVGP